VEHSNIETTQISSIIFVGIDSFCHP